MIVSAGIKSIGEYRLPDEQDKKQLISKLNRMMRNFKATSSGVLQLGEIALLKRYRQEFGNDLFSNANQELKNTRVDNKGNTKVMSLLKRKYR